jgi:predicted permease
MTWISRARAWARSLVHRSRFEREMQAEVRFHLESYADDLVRSGVPRDEAARRARVEFGSVEWKKDDVRAALGVRLADDLANDVRYAIRVLRKSPGFTFVTIATLALGIGANTAIFTLMDAALLRLIPVHDATRIYQVRRVGPSGPGRLDGVFTYPLYAALRDRQDVFSSIASWGNTTFNLAHGGAVQNAQGLWVSGSYFGTLEMSPAAGRLIGPADDRSGCAAIAVLSHAFWETRYGGSPAAIGSTIQLDSKPFEIVGVTPNGFTGMDVGYAFDVAAPQCATALYDGGRSRLDRRSWWWLAIVGRLAPGVMPEQAAVRLSAMSPEVAAAAVPPDWDVKYKAPFLAAKLVPAPAGGGIGDSVRSSFQRPLTILMAVVGIVLLIACANVASLLLARGAAQSREIGVRLALGAGRARLIRQYLTHALVLSIAGAAAGMLFAHWTTSLLVNAISTEREPLFFELTPDWRVAGFTAAVALLTSIIFGVLPALRTTRGPLTGSVRGPGQGTPRDPGART